MIFKQLSLNTLLILMLLLNIGCTSLSSINEPVERSISSEISPKDSECEQLLEKFLPAKERIENMSFNNLSYDNFYQPILANGNMENKILIEKFETEAADMFNSFSKEAKDPAIQGKFKLLVDPHEALMARLMLIKKAKTSIDLTYYIFQDSETSRILIDELRAALRRGVNVRLMVDGSGSIAAAAKNFFKEIQVLNEVLGGKIYDTAGNVVGHAKFEAIEINPTFNARAGIKGWYDKVIGFITGKKVSNDDFSIFHRAHDKILLIDANSPENSMAIIGGRNISNHYYKIGTQEERDATYNDLDILVKHIAFTETTDEKTVIKNVLLDHFNRLYYYSANKNFEDFIFKQDRIGAADVLSEIRHTRNQIMRTEGAELGAKMAKMEQDDFLNKNFDQGYISFLDEIENLVRKNSLKNMTYSNNQNSIMKNMWIQVEKAEKDILICSPYIYLTEKEMDFLVSWLAQNPSRKFRLITNSTSTSDNLFAQSMVEYFVMPKLMKKLTDAKIPIKQFEVLAYGNTQNKEFGGKVAQGKLHAKFWMVDNYAMGIGTSNFDPVSRLTNSEIVANIFPTKGTQSIESLNKYYQSLKQDSAMWNSPEFVKSKYRKELKKKLIIQSVIARIIKLFKLLPQN